ncbi:4Fe-4S dicluster domain-containing protein [Methanopyrus sp. SNP6]|uniref:4Fe-4S dicluster domain-containing protein n=1 Tax=Methanopyrus sp. SNP6 TaxID=1937005 RepID=UPI0011E5BEA6|nr:4Fe-4S binding protein [Methanopyrus sp. SNP6]
MQVVRRIEIDRTRCDGASCALCVEVCERGVLKIKDEEVVIADLEACDACDKCVRVCPNDAIDLYRYRERQFLSAMVRAMNNSDDNGLEVARRVVMRGRDVFGDTWFYLRRELERTCRIKREAELEGKRAKLYECTCKVCGKKFKGNKKLDVCSECANR